MTDKPIIVKCVCGQTLRPEENIQGSYRVHCSQCNIKTDYFPAIETAANVWIKFCKSVRRWRHIEHEIIGESHKLAR